MKIYKLKEVDNIYKLKKSEIETTMVYDDSGKFASVYTCNKQLTRKLDEYVKKSSEIYVEKEDEYSKTYIIPKKWIKIKMPRELSIEEREILRIRAKANLCKKKVISVNHPTSTGGGLR